MSNESKSDTPLVDANLEYTHCSCDVCGGTKYAPADFARRLERVLKVAEDGINALLGLIQLRAARHGEENITNHRIDEARAALAQIKELRNGK